MAEAATKKKEEKKPAKQKEHHHKHFGAKGDSATKEKEGSAATT